MAAATPCILVSDTSVSTALNGEIVGRAGGTLEKAELVRERSGTELETPAPLHTSCVISDKSPPSLSCKFLSCKIKGNPSQRPL